MNGGLTFHGHGSVKDFGELVVKARILEFQLDMLGFTTADVVGKGADLLLCTGCGSILEGWE